MKVRALASVLATGALLGALTACGSDSGGSGSSGSSSGDDLGLITAGTLTVCSDVPYPPFENFDKSTASGFSGFDVDIVEAIAQDLGVKVAIKDSDFNALQSGLALNARQCDLVASAMTITPEREQKLSFSDGYYDSEQSLLVPADSDITSIDDLAGKKVGVQKGTTGATYTTENAPDAKAVVFPSDGEMYQALKAGQVDALLQDLPVNLDHQNDKAQAGKFKVVQTFKTDEQYGLAMKKGNTALVDAVDAALKKLRDDGDYQKFYDTYFSTDSAS